MTVYLDVILRDCVSENDGMFVNMCVFVYLHHRSLHGLPMLQPACGDKHMMKASVRVRVCVCYLSRLCVVG